MDLWLWLAVLVLTGTAAFFIAMWRNGVGQPLDRRTGKQRLAEMPIKRSPD